ncbi:MAG TPA: DNA repair protein RecN [Puia sp.]|jgi:DNA repair protein RecN (Recombination protein N)|nr:DNA repair protein RecN [Puia sp.]
MLKQLHISNYAIIEEINIDFSKNLNVITGETGAGKSILMGALSLILGDRADTTVLMDTEKKCFVEGVFVVESKKGVRNFLKDNDLDAVEELVIRREIAATGKSRAFVNDTPVNLVQLRVLSSMLVDLHQQFDSLELGESDFQREVLDALAKNFDLLNEYQLSFKKLSVAKKDLLLLQEQKAQFTKVFDYNKFLFDELQEIGLKENELEDLDKELKLLIHSEDIKTALSKAYFDLQESEMPIVQQLKASIHQMQPFSTFHHSLPELLQRLQSAQIELQDIASEMESINDTVHYDPKRIEEINERISAGYKLMKKHGASNTNELIAIKNNLEDQLQAVLNIDESILAKQDETRRCLEQANKQAAAISGNRQQMVKPLEEKVNRLLAQVGMPNAKLKVHLLQTALNPFGMDVIEFLFDANRSNRFEPVGKVASGGELSRLMLCIKSLVAESIDLATLIFDEIDTGISGEAAKQVGMILKKLSGQRQVICITHQPQIAGKADAHYFVYKEIRNDTVKTNLRILSQDERITAIAKMLSGEKPTAAALENAREMVMN